MQNFYLYKDAVIHKCPITDTYRNIYSKKTFRCLSCKIEVPYILYAGARIVSPYNYKDYNNNYIFIGENVAPLKRLPPDAIEVNF